MAHSKNPPGCSTGQVISQVWFPLPQAGFWYCSSRIYTGSPQSQFPPNSNCHQDQTLGMWLGLKPQALTLKIKTTKLIISSRSFKMKNTTETRQTNKKTPLDRNDRLWLKSHGGLHAVFLQRICLGRTHLCLMWAGRTVKHRARETETATLVPFRCLHPNK